MWFWVLAWTTTWAADLDPLAEAVAQVHDEVQDLDGIDTALLTPEQALDRYEDALFHYMIGDVEGAAQGFWVLRARLPDVALRADAEHYLTVTLVEIGATRLADQIMADVIATPEHPWSADAALRRLTLFGEHRTSAEFAELFDELKAAGHLDETSDTLRYTLGRAYWHLGDLDASDVAFASIDPSSSEFPRAEYFRGVIAVQRRQLDLATERFHTAAALASDPRVVEEARLSCARIAYEQHDYAEAAVNYRAIEEDSAVRGEALQELTWTEVRGGLLPSAIGTMQTYLMDFPSDPKAGSMAVVLGHLHALNEDWTQAGSAYDQAISELNRPERLAARIAADPHLGTAAELDAAVNTQREDVDQVRQDADEVQRLLEEREELARHRLLRGRAFQGLARVASQRAALAAAEAETHRGRPARAQGREIRESHEALQTRLAQLQDEGTLAYGAEVTGEELEHLLDRANTLVSDVRQSRGDENPDALLDRLHVTLDEAEALARTVLGRVEAEVAADDGPLQRELRAEYTEITALSHQVDVLQPKVAALKADVEAEATERFEVQLDGDLRDAMAGASDAAFSTLQEIRSERQTKQMERENALRDLEILFRQIAARSI